MSVTPQLPPQRRCRRRRTSGSTPERAMVSLSTAAIRSSTGVSLKPPRLALHSAVRHALTMTMSSLATAEAVSPRSASVPLTAARIAWACADNGVQIHGGTGFAVEQPASRLLADARILNIFEGAGEIQAQVIARRLLEGAN